MEESIGTLLELAVSQGIWAARSARCSARIHERLLQTETAG